MGTVKAAKPKTRERILDTCRTLFNERGLHSVSTAEIASCVGINEGNLYYHFKRKEDILLALFERFSAVLLTTASVESAHETPTDRYRNYLEGWFNMMWEWRFFYRDVATVAILAPKLRPRLRAVIKKGLALTRDALNKMVQADLIRIEPDVLERLLVNAWIIATYWIDYIRNTRNLPTLSRKAIDEGAEHVMTLFLPYLTPAGRKLIAKTA